MSLPLRALPLRALPSRTLPLRAIQLISEYSKPVTRADWRYSRPIITVFRLYLTVCPYKSLLQYGILMNISCSHWFEMYLYIKHNGIYKYCQLYDKKYDDVYDIDGVYEAMDRYSGW
jgi:hypothetical protein